MILVDANIILRYLLNDHAELSPKAAAILEQQQVILPIEAACEVVFVLQKVYNVTRQETRQQLTKLLHEKLIEIEKPEVFLKALEYYSTSTLDFVDTLLWAYYSIEQHQILTFDKKLNQSIQQMI